MSSSISKSCYICYIKCLYGSKTCKCRGKRVHVECLKVWTIRSGVKPFCSACNSPINVNRLKHRDMDLSERRSLSRLKRYNESIKSLEEERENAEKERRRHYIICYHSGKILGMSTIAHLLAMIVFLFYQTETSKFVMVCLSRLNLVVQFISAGLFAYSSVKVFKDCNVDD